jgi:hypothetical protein
MPITHGPAYNSYVPVRLVRYMAIPYPGYVPGIAVIESQEKDVLPASHLISSYSTHGPSGSCPSTPPSQDSGASAFDRIANMFQGGHSGPMIPDSVWNKNLDFEDEIFIPTFCTGEPPRPSHSAAGLQHQARSSSQVPPQHVRLNNSVITGPKADTWNLSPQHSSMSVSERMIDSSMLTPPTSTPESNCTLSINLPNWRSYPSNQFHSGRTPPRSRALHTPLSSMARSSRTSQEADNIARQIMAELERINARSGSGGPRPFMPSRAVLKRNIPESLSHQTLLQPNPTRSVRDAKYYGRANLPAHKNCAIYIMGIPAKAGYADVLDSIRGGKIYACLMDPPNAEHLTSAAKLVFFTRASAELFMQRHYRVGIYVLGQRVKAIWNRIRYDAHDKPHQSRVVRISGPASWMDFEFFEKFFKARLEFQEESRSEIPCSHEGHALYEWRFASLRAQAELAYIAIVRELSDIFKVEYGPDPCARPWM